MIQEFSIICPPPNVTGELHLGHALVVAVQNFFVYANRILGKNAFILPGYDHGGIGTQVTTMKKTNLTKNSPDLVNRIREFAEESKSAIKKQMEILQLQADKKYEKYTFDESHNELVKDSFIKLYEKGLIQRKHTLINFDTTIGTAVSDLEVVYKERDSKIFFINYETLEGELVKVATTRPETIFADCALMVHPDDVRYSNLTKVRVPLTNREIPILRDNYVDMNFGTGVLKITPAHDINDWALGKKHSLQVINIINKEGNINIEDDISNPLNGMSVSQARKKIVEILQCESIPIKQKIPVNSSTGAVIEYLLQDQWFLDMKDAAILALEKSPIIEPQCWKENYVSWLQRIEPWCISRDIIWGHRIPVWYKDDQYKVCKDVPGEGWEQSNETLDTWFSSALWPLSYKKSFGIYPTDLLVTAYDILFFWVAKMIMMSLIIEGSLPFKSVYIHQLVRDKNGLKMSKTKGNVLNPIDIIEKHGLDTMNFALLSMLSPNTKIRFGEECLLESRKVVTKIKNLNNYMTNRKDKLESFLMVDEYFRSRIIEVEKLFTQYIRDLQIHIVKQKVIELLYEICDWMVEIDKISQTCITEIYKHLKKLLFPFFPNLINSFGFENIWSNYESHDHASFTKLKSVISKIRYLKKHQIQVEIKINKMSEFICKFCNIESGNKGNFLYEGMILHLDKIEPLKKELDLLKEKQVRLERFFLNPEKINIEFLNEKKQEIEIIKSEIKNLEAILYG